MWVLLLLLLSNFCDASNATVNAMFVLWRKTFFFFNLLLQHLIGRHSICFILATSRRKQAPISQASVRPIAFTVILFRWNLGLALQPVFIIPHLHPQPSIIHVLPLLLPSSLASVTRLFDFISPPCSVLACAHAHTHTHTGDVLTLPQQCEILNSAQLMQPNE